jgi:hypothetical protein
MGEPWEIKRLGNMGAPERTEVSFRIAASARNIDSKLIR